MTCHEEGAFCTMTEMEAVYVDSRWRSEEETWCMSCSGPYGAVCMRETRPHANGNNFCETVLSWSGLVWPGLGVLLLSA